MWFKIYKLKKITLNILKYGASINIGHKKRGKNGNSTPFNIQYPMKNQCEPKVKLLRLKAEVDECYK